ncbi:MAG: GH92 family glycosyl hydrolase [Bacteroidales bacterium]|jgi:predicted alpha-1,2-mannosidase|nr:GH92 family glycosyl hydrolase [Bacteroidales bacterium]
MKVVAISGNSRLNRIKPAPVLMAVIMAVLVLSCARQDEMREPLDPVELVNPLMGTDSEFRYSNGNTYPAIALPWGMNFWTPQTGKMGDGWGYTYDSYRIRGIKQTHQPSPWINDYAAFAFMPVTGKLIFDEDERASWFSHKAEVAKPYYYSVYLADHDVVAEVTPTERAAIFRFTFPESDSSFILLDAFNGGSMVKIIPEERRIEGYCRNNHGGVPANFHNYFVAQFDRDFEIIATWEGKELARDSAYAEGRHAGAVVGFKTGKGDRVTVKVASSFISPSQAVANLERETGGKSFDDVMEEGREIWNRELGRITVKGGSDDQRRTFYSCLYRTLLFPRQFHETTSEGRIVHYSPYNGEVCDGYMYTDNGFWDTFRAVFPFFTLMYPDVNAMIMEGLVNTYLESGWLPEWASPGHRNCMIGSNSASLIADSWLKGIRGYDIEKLYEAMVKNTTGHGPVRSVGRYGASWYNDLGYVPYDVGIAENAARTLEYAYADFCIWKLGEALGKSDEELALYRARAGNYRNLFDAETKLMRGRNADGTFQSPFSPYKWGDAFTEGNSWHYTWSVFHDMEGLIELMGGREEFIAMLDSVFVVPPIFDFSYYGYVIHEIREMQVMNMGNYAHGNQPIQHMIYLYNYAGQPWKTQMRVREVMDRLYDYTPDGYCGDEDNGQTSAWYVFSALGFYPVAPGTCEYVIGSPLFDEVTLKPEGGRDFVIEAEGNGPGNVFIREAVLNGKRMTRNYLMHSDIQNGGRLRFRMSPEPDRTRGTDESSFPYSMSRAK